MQSPRPRRGREKSYRWKCSCRLYTFSRCFSSSLRFRVSILSTRTPWANIMHVSSTAASKGRALEPSPQPAHEHPPSHRGTLPLQARVSRERGTIWESSRGLSFRRHSTHLSLDLGIRPSGRMSWTPPSRPIRLMTHHRKRDDSGPVDVLGDVGTRGNQGAGRSLIQAERSGRS